MAIRVGIDVGGTFTDLILHDEASGEVRVEKVPSVPGRPEQGCLDALEAALGAKSLASVEYFLHGNTVGLNALLERKGAVVGLLATAGFRDVMEVRRGDRDDMFDLFWSPPEPLVPRSLRRPVRERVRADGEVHERLVAEDVTSALAEFRKRGVTSIAVAFLNAYANPEHEQEAERLLRAHGFDGPISLSHRISREYREYERTSTTIVDAYVREKVSSYLARLERSLQERGLRGHCLVMRSGGGSLAFADAAERPFETLMSGPVAGAEGAGKLARRFGLGDLITADVGGTSFDTCLIVEGYPQLKYQGEVQGMPLQTSWVDVRSIGAGGGSIASVDVGGLLQVGPQSAGAQPGPACYGRGGTQPTLTDAGFFLGMLGRGRLARGLDLDYEKARKAIKSVSDELGASVEQTACGIVRLAAVKMTNAIREITIEQGIDPRKMTLLSYGGAGPMMATELARALDIDEIVVPCHAGNFSAWGLLGADVLTMRAQTKIMPLSEESLDQVNDVLAALFAELEHNGATGIALREVRLDMRYRGQEYTLSIVPTAEHGRISAGAEAVGRQFAENYRRAFGIDLDEPLDVVSVRALLRRPLPSFAEQSSARRVVNRSTHSASIRAYSFALEQFVDFKLFERAQLASGEVLKGPAIVSELTTTTYVDADFEFEVGGSGLMHLRRSLRVQRSHREAEHAAP